VDFVDVVIARRAGRREWAGLAVLTLPCLLYAMDLTVLNLAIPYVSAAAGRDTLGGAVATAANLPGQAGEVLVRVARQAFTQGLHVAFAVSAAAVLGAAILAAIQLRHLRPAPEPDGAAEPDGRESHVA
jgi:DHA2 family multidrug resistance protein-like MFS transporter